MGSHIRAARAVSGVLAVVALLALVMGEFFYDGQVRPRTIAVLLALIAALLGVDIASEFLPLRITVEDADESDSQEDS